MNKNKFYTLIILFLLISNCLLVGFFIMGKPPHPMKKEPKYFIIDRLELNKNQIKAYESLIPKHREAIDQKSKEIEKVKNELYRFLNESENVAKTDSLFRIIAYKQTEIETIHFNHFKDIKAICRKDQMEKFSLLTQEIAELFDRKPPRRR